MAKKTTKKDKKAKGNGVFLDAKIAEKHEKKKANGRARDKFGCLEGSAASAFAEILDRKPVDQKTAIAIFRKENPTSRIGLGQQIKDFVRRGIVKIDKKGLIRTIQPK